MPGPAPILRELHRLRRHAADLQAEIARGPQLLRARQAKLTRQEEELREAHEAIKRLKVSTHEKEVSLKTKVQQVAKHERQLNEAGSKKEYDALKAEIATEKQDCSRLEDEILDMMADAEDRTAKLPEQEQALAKAREDAGRAAEETEARRKQLQELLDSANRQLGEIEATLPADVRTQYNRLLAAKGEDALSAVQGRTCTACYTEITAQSYNELTQGQFVVCKNCGRILYLPEG